MRIHIWNRQPNPIELANLSLEDKVYCTDSRWIPFFNREVQLWNLNAIKSDVNQRFLEVVAQFSDCKIDDLPFTEMLHFDGFWAWNYFKFKTYFSVREWLYEWELLKLLNEHHQEVHYYTSHEWLSDYSAHFTNASIHFDSAKSMVAKKNTIVPFLQYCFRSFLRLKSLGSFDNKHLVIDKSIKQSFWNVELDAIENGNIYLNHLMDVLDDSAVVISDKDCPPLKSNATFDYREIPKHPLGESLFFTSLFNPINTIRTWLLYRQYSRVLNQLKSSESIEKEFIIRFLKNEKSAIAIFYFKFLAWQRFFRKHSIASVTLIDENSPLVRAVVDAARTQDVPVFAIQHGSIHSAHPAYMYAKGDAHRNIFPYRTLVWGEYWKKVLVEKGNYPEKSICVVGQQRTDSIHALVQRKDYFKSRFSLPDAPIILFATQPQQDISMRRQAAKDVFTALKSMPTMHGLIKLHPAEKNDEMYYRAISVESGCFNFSFAKDMDLYIGLALADIVITAFSTVGTEAVYFKKPILIWDPLNQDLLGLLNKGLAFPVKDAEDIMQITTEIMVQGISKSDQLLEEYISMYAHKIDGNVASRIWQIIQSA